MHPLVGLDGEDAIEGKRIAGVVAGSVSYGIATGGITQSGVVTLGSSSTPNERLLATIQKSGIQLHEFVGS